VSWCRTPEHLTVKRQRTTPCNTYAHNQTQKHARTHKHKHTHPACRPSCLPPRADNGQDKKEGHIF
jgi:hypothetical protein